MSALTSEARERLRLWLCDPRMGEPPTGDDLLALLADVAAAERERDEARKDAGFQEACASTYNDEVAALRAQVATLTETLWDVKRVLLTRHLGDGSDLSGLSMRVSAALLATSPAPQPTASEGETR